MVEYVIWDSYGIDILTVTDGKYSQKSLPHFANHDGLRRPWRRRDELLARIVVLGRHPGDHIAALSDARRPLGGGGPPQHSRSLARRHRPMEGSILRVFYALSRLDHIKPTSFQYDCNLERQVLEQLRLMDEENEKKAREDEEAMEEYRAKKEREKREKEEKEKQEEEERRKKEEEEREEEERKKREQQEEDRKEDEGAAEETEDESTCEEKDIDSSPEVEPVTKPASAPRPPPQPQADSLPGGLQGLQLSEGQAKANPAHVPGGAKINFSEFEAQSDPFDSMELKTINDMQELAAVLQTTTTAAPQSHVAPASTATAGPRPSTNYQQHPQQLPYPSQQQVEAFFDHHNHLTN